MPEIYKPIETPTRSTRHTSVPERGMVNGPRATGDSSKAALNPKPGTANGHIAWFDYAKGICIILVVMMHSTLGVGEAFAESGHASTGFMHYVVAFAKPFRMPDFFMLAGLFLGFAISRNWMHYLDKKLVHFAYFYALWTLIQAIIKTAATTGIEAGGLAHQFLNALVNPYPTLWFIYVLPLFFIATKLLRNVPAWLLLSGAALLQILPVHTGWTAIDHFAVHYYVFFLAGYLFSAHIFAVAQWARENVALALTVVGSWAFFNTALAFTASPIGGWSNIAALPVVSIALGAMGALAIVVLASLLSKFNVAPFIRYCGQNSIVIYISFAIPMALTRVILLKTHIITDTGFASLTVWLVALISPLILHALLAKTPLRFLYERPKWIALPYTKTGSKSAINPATTAPNPA